MNFFKNIFYLYYYQWFMVKNKAEKDVFSALYYAFCDLFKFLLCLKYHKS